MVRELSAPTCWVVAIVVLIAAGLVTGRLDGRWASSADLDAASRRLDRFPDKLGSWTAQPGDPDLATLHRIGIAGGVLSRFRDSTSGELVTVMLVCGRPGPVSVHTPEVCYQGSGYDLAAPVERPVPGFLAATMARPGPTVDRLQVFWSWSAGEAWSTPANPRVEFGGKPYLYKLYVVRPMTGTSPPRSEAVERFCRDLAAYLRARLGTDLA